MRRFYDFLKIGIINPTFMHTTNHFFKFMVKVTRYREFVLTYTHYKLLKTFNGFNLYFLLSMIKRFVYFRCYLPSNNMSSQGFVLMYINGCNLLFLFDLIFYLITQYANC